MSTYPVAIIGAGPSGLAAAIQLKRQGVDCIVLEKSIPGGLLKNANLIENYPGFPHGIKGPELVALIVKQAEANGVAIRDEEVLAVDFGDDQFCLTSTKGEYTARILLVASGTKPKPIPGLAIPDNCVDRVHYEVYPLAQVSDQTIAVIGAGDAAFDYSLNLAERKNRLTIYNRGDKSVALELLQKRVAAHPSIEYRLHTRLETIARASIDQLKLTFKTIDQTTQLEADHLLLAIGREPSMNFLAPNLKAQLRRLQIDRRLYLVGDVNAGIYRQTSIATGEAVKAAMIIQKSLKGLS